MKNKYKIGQTVVHLSHGIGKIVNIVPKDVIENGKVLKQQSIYVMEINDNGTPKKVFVPVDTADNKIRQVVSKDEAVKVLNYIKTTHVEVIDHQTWNRRYREYMEKIHSGEIQAIAEVFVSLRQLKKEKDLSFGERKLYQQAQDLLQKELNAAGIELVL